VTDDSPFKKQVRARMAETGEKYTTARRTVISGRAALPPVTLRVYLNPYLDLDLTDETARAYDGADEAGRREMACRLLADHIQAVGSEEAGVAMGSELMLVQDLRIEEIGAAIHRQIGQAAGVTAIGVSGDLDRVRVDIHAVRRGAAFGHGGAMLDRLRDEIQELTGKPVQLNIVETEPASRWH
jgi:hypothetical protein